MNYRRLKPELVRFLESDSIHGGNKWPKYRNLRRFAIRHHYAFSEREYAQLKRVHIAVEGLVNGLVRYLCEVAKSDLAIEFQDLPSGTTEQWIERLTELNDGTSLRRRDYYKKSSWKEMPLLCVLSDHNGEAESYCRNEELAIKVARAQYIEVGRDRVKPKERNNESLVLAMAEKQCGSSVDQFTGAVKACWQAVPECVWLTTKAGTPIGGSIVLPLTEEAYNRLRAGVLSESQLQPDQDLILPSRHLWIHSMTTFPEVPRSRLPGVHSARQLQKICQHGAILIGPNGGHRTPVRILAVTGSEPIERAVTQLGYTKVGTTLKNTNSPFYELVVPPPEVTVADFSTAATTFATLIGTAWRLLQRNEGNCE